jgi:hypothetical protein
VVSLSAEDERDQLHSTMDAWTLTADHLGTDSRYALLHALALDLDGASQPAPQPLTEETQRYVADTGQLVWDATEQGAGYFLVNTSGSKLFTGFVRDRSFSLGDVTLRIGKTRLDWATVSMTRIQGKEIGSAGRTLIAATGWVQNTGMELQQLGEDRVTLSNQWGGEPILCEGIPAEITLPVGTRRVTLYPLDQSGNRREAIAVKNREGQAQVTLGPQHKTLWYELVVD